MNLNPFSHYCKICGRDTRGTCNHTAEQWIAYFKENPEPYEPPKIGFDWALLGLILFAAIVLGGVALMVAPAITDAAARYGAAPVALCIMIWCYIANKTAND
jgi:hypothetical protein